MKMLGLITLCVFSIAAPLAAQNPHARGAMAHGDMDDMMPMMREMMAPMLRIMAYTPQHLLARKDTLKLTADQISKLTTIQNSAKAEHDAAEADFKTHFGAINQGFQTSAPDTSALRPHFDVAHQAMGKAHWAMLAAAAQARAVLTDAQRQKMDALVTSMQQRMQRQQTM
jgi:hypothetical protein